jgi:hypothetical protein
MNEGLRPGAGEAPDNSRVSVRERVERARPITDRWKLPSRIRTGWSLAWLIAQERKRR